jgi:hypothetical protein
MKKRTLIIEDGNEVSIIVVVVVVVVASLYIQIELTKTLLDYSPLTVNFIFSIQSNCAKKN